MWQPGRCGSCRAVLRTYVVYGLSVGRCGISFPVPCGFGVLPSLRRTGVRVVLSRRVSFLRFIVVGIVTFLMAYSHCLSACFCRRGWLRPRNFLCSLPVVPCLCLSRAKRRIVGAAWYIRMADFNYPRLLPGCSEPTILHYMLYEGGNTLREGGRGADTAAGAWNRTKAYAKTVCRCGNRRSRLMRFLARPSPSCRVIPVRGMSGSAAFPSNRKPPLPNVFVYSVFDVDFFLFG